MLIATYGSLKRGKYNHGRMGPQEYKGDAAVAGFQLFVSQNCPYPCVVRDALASVVVEVFDVSDSAYRRLCWMEEGAGYKAATIPTQYGAATIWYQQSPPVGWVKGGVSW